MIDLSFLTEEEQETILAVLKRDADLKQAEEQRIQNLQKTLNDQGKLKSLTGEWFYETKQLRHQDRIHGSDIIRASMKHTHKPITILELTQILPEKSSFVSSDNKEVFVPPVLRGVLQESQLQLSSRRYANQNQYEAPQDKSQLVLQSSTKQRKNPFNIELKELLDEAVDQTQKPNEEPIPSSYFLLSYASNLRQDPNCLVTQNASIPMSMPENTTTSTSSQDCFVEVEGPGDRHTNSAAAAAAAAPRGILKRMSTSSSIDSLVSHLDVQSPVGLDSPPETSIDRRQVRFSNMVSHIEDEWQHGKELGEHCLLDVDPVASSETENSDLNNHDLEDSDRRPTDDDDDELIQSESGANAQEDVSEHCHSEPLSPALSSLLSAEQESGKPVPLETEPEEDSHSQATDTDGPTGHNVNQKKLHEQSTDVSIESTSDSKPSASRGSKSSSHAILPLPRRKILGIFRREKEKGDKVQNRQKEEVTMQQKEAGNTHHPYSTAADTTVDKPACAPEAKPSQTTEVRTLQLTALQNTPFKETVATIDRGEQQDATDDRIVQSPERLSSLKAFWEKENTGPKIIFTREEARQENNSKTGVEASHGSQTHAESVDDLSVRKATAARSQEKIPSLHTEQRLSVDVEQDGTYRANPVVVYDETDDSLTASVTEPQTKIKTSGPVAAASNAQEQQLDAPVPLPRKSSASPQEDRPAKIRDLKHFWESEYTGPRVIAARGRGSSSSSVLDNKVVSPQPSVVLRSMKVTDKGFVSQSPDGSQRPQSMYHQYQVKADIESQERPLSPSKSTLRSKDQDDEVRRSPSKTCHPRVLPREPSSPERSRLEGSPLKTFPIDIEPHTKALEEQQVKPTPVPRQKKSPTHGAKQTAVTDLTSSPPPSHPEDRGSNTQQTNPSSSTSTQSTKASQKKVGTFTRLARSLFPQDIQHYLGPQEKAYVPPFPEGKSSTEDLVGNQGKGPTKGNPADTSSWIVQNKDGNSRQDTTTRSWSLPRASSGNRQRQHFGYQLGLEKKHRQLHIEPKRLLRNGLHASGSISSLHHIDFGDIEVQGSIQFAVNYIQKLGEFHIFVVLCRELAVADAKKNRSDPYVKCYLLPDKTKLGKRKTTVKKKTLNPTYNEILRFKVTMEVLKTQNLNVSVWHNDTFGRNTFLGEVDLDLSELDFSNTQINEYALKARVSAQTSALSSSHLMDDRGLMRVALRFLPQTSHSKRASGMETGEVQIWVKDCKNLPSVRGVVIDPFVKCTVLPDTSSKSRQKTRVVKRTANPMFNHTMVYDGFRTDDLREACVEITVWDHDRLRSHYIGGLRLGLGTGKSYGVEAVWMDSTAEEAHLWQRMLRSDGEWVEDVLPLRMLMMAKGMSK
ncbi:hypothetical protein INR49_032428 [Caranx melampygus]|nr:hypothetical protein INR49_032428 [Caranx melampygus]